jgi:hypothetical protein
VRVIAEGFRGWEKGADWGDLSFLLELGDQIEKIAIVGDPRREDELKVFAAAGFRKASVEFFSDPTRSGPRVARLTCLRGRAATGE